MNPLPAILALIKMPWFQSLLASTASVAGLSWLSNKMGGDSMDVVQARLAKEDMDAQKEATRRIVEADRTTRRKEDAQRRIGASMARAMNTVQQEADLERGRQGDASALRELSAMGDPSSLANLASKQVSWRDILG